MTFPSPLFLFLFLPFVLGLYALLPARLRNLFLLGASLLFYSWGDGFSILVLAASIVFNHGAGLLLEKAGSARQRKMVLAAAIAGNLLLLFYFKYLPFAIVNLHASGILPAQAPDFANWRLPLGISFFTFAVLSYLIDIYRQKIRAERNPLDFALYVSMFAKITAGPIVRFREISAELGQRTVPGAFFADGVQRFVIGLGKKVLIANPVGSLADEAFNLQHGLSMPTAWLGMVCYTIYIYFDFSGYSDMAIGLGRMFGFTFGENFNYPYVSQSIQEFWRRWHISLSSWLRDYLYIPLGGSRGSKGRTYGNLLVVFVLCGAWHGANWTFIAWGLYHGFFLVLERLGPGALLRRSPRPVRHLYALLVVMIGWVLFRAQDLSQAAHYLRALFSFHTEGFDYFQMTFVNRQVLAALLLGILGSMPLPAIFKALQRRIAEHGSARLLVGYDWCTSAAMAVLLILVFVASVMQLAVSTFSPFIYTRF